MSTRCNIHFCEDYPAAIVANVYRHCDGYPDGECGVLADLQAFFVAVEHDTKDTRFDDAEYLAAKYVAWQAAQNHQGRLACHPEGGPLDFLSVGICLEDHGDIEYRYSVICKNYNRPAVAYVRVP